MNKKKINGAPMIPFALLACRIGESELRVTELAADKMLEDYSPDDIFDMMFTATYDFEQDFTFDFEDTDEFLAFVDANSERLDSYKDEYSSAIGWIEGGMVC